MYLRRNIMKSESIIVNLENLEKFVNQGYYYFEFNYKSKKYTLLYKGRDTNKPASIIILKPKTQSDLILNLISDFKIDAHNPNQFLEIKNFFEVQDDGSKYKWNLLDLFRHIDNHLRIKRNPDENERSYYRKSLPNPNAIYFKCLVSHENNGKKRSIGNYQKVKEYLPDLIPYIENRNVSVRFTSDREQKADYRKFLSKNN